MSQRDKGKKSIRVLLIEDNEDDAVMIRAMISQMVHLHYDLHWVCNLSDGNDSIQKELPSIILLDLALPDSRGTAGLESLQSSQPEIPIIVLTGDDDQSKALAAIQIGAEDYLIKGQINVALLERALRHAMERKKVKLELEVANAALKELVGQDPLTGVLNRRGFQDVLGQLAVERKRTGEHLYALLLDLDDFKGLNDKFGYGVGDMALREVSRTILQTIRTSDYVTRVGGDEFIVLLVNTRAEEAMLVADKLRLAISEILLLIDAGTTINLTCSAGIGPIDEDSSILEGLVVKLESALKRSKSLGKNRITVQNGSLQYDAASIIESSTEEVRLLLDGMDFYALCQPVYDLALRKEIAYEMLIRIRHETGQTIQDLFLLARQHKLLTLIDFQCFRTCLQTAAKLPAHAKVHVNLFPSTLMALKAKQFEEVLKQCGGRPVCVELSEQQIVGEASYLLKEVDQLKKLGVGIAIDDVGFGYSSLESLVILEPDIVKVDISAIRGIAKDKTKQGQFRRLVKVIEACEADYVVEGIENEADLSFLLRNGVECGQGFLFGKPRPV